MKQKDGLKMDNVSQILESSEELRAIVELAGNGISLLDTNGVFLYANPFFRNMTGYTMEELRKESCITLSSPEYRELSKLAVKKAIECGNVTNFKKNCRRKDGFLMTAYMSLSYIEQRNILVMITADLTKEEEYKKYLELRVAEEVEKYKKQHEIFCHQNRLAAMGEMLSAIAHQWRQPLNSLSLAMQRLSHSFENDGFDRELFKTKKVLIMDKINYLSQTIEDFYNFFKPTKESVSFDIVDCTKSSVRLIEAELEFRMVALHFVKSRKLQHSPKLNGNPNEFKQIILNLLSNASKATSKKFNGKKGGKIVVLFTETKEHIIIKIRDNGIGIDDGHIETIFEPFGAENKSGVGFGLYMSRLIIKEKMNGSLVAIPRKKGAEFRLALAKDF